MTTKKLLKVDSHVALTFVIGMVVGAIIMALLIHYQVGGLDGAIKRSSNTSNFWGDTQQGLMDSGTNVFGAW